MILTFMSHLSAPNGHGFLKSHDYRRKYIYRWDASFAYILSHEKNKINSLRVDIVLSMC